MKYDKIQYIYFPKIVELLKDFNHPKPDFFIEKIFIFLSRIYYSQNHKRIIHNDKLLKRKWYTYIPVNELQIYLTQHDMESFLNYLNDKKIIEVDHTKETMWNSETKSKPKYFYQFKINDFSLYDDKIDILKIKHKKNQNTHNRIVLIKDRKYDDIIIRMMNMESKFEFNITKEEFIRDCRNYYPTYVNKKIESKEKYNNIDDYVEILLSTFNNMMIWNGMTQLNRKIYMMGCDKFSGRFHNIFTYLPEYIKYEKYFKNFKLQYEIDVKQMQGLCLGVKLLENNFSIDCDIIKDLNSGDIYEKYTTDNIDRQIKKRLLYGDLYSGYGTPNFNRFKTRFPPEGNLLQRLQFTTKLTYINTNIPIPKRKIIPALLQRKEVEIFREIWKKLLDRRIKFLVIHDAIYCSKDDLNVVYRITNSVLNSHLGLIKHDIEIIKKMNMVQTVVKNEKIIKEITIIDGTDEDIENIKWTEFYKKYREKKTIDELIDIYLKIN